MNSYNPFKITQYKTQYEQKKSQLEKLIYNKLYEDFLIHHNFTNDIDKLQNNTEEKYMYTIVIGETDSIDDIKFRYKLVSKNNRYRKNWTVLTKELDSELYTGIFELIEKYFSISDEYNELKELDSIIKISKKNLKENYQENIQNLKTELYRYYYANADKIIDSDSNYLDVHNCSRPIIGINFEQFYNWVADKYSINKNNFKLDFIQAFMKNSMGLESDYTVIPESKSESAITLENSNQLVKIKHYPRRYIKCYQPQYEVFVENKLTGQKTTIGYKQFDTDRRLDLFYSSMLEFIDDTYNIIWD